MGGAPAFKRTLAKPLVDITLFTFFSLELVRAIRRWFAHRPAASPVEGVGVAPLIHALDASQALLLERLVSVALEELSSDDERHHRVCNPAACQVVYRVIDRTTGVSACA